MVTKKIKNNNDSCESVHNKVVRHSLYIRRCGAVCVAAAVAAAAAACVVAMTKRARVPSSSDDRFIIRCLL